MIIIHSSRFVNAEFEAEIGLIPPCMLPIGNKKMLELQVANFKAKFPHEKIVVTLPKHYKLTINEQAVIKELEISVQRICDQLSFAEAILYLLNIESENCDDTIRILQGDRLLNDIPLANDCIAVAGACRQSDWYDRYQRQDNESRWLGYFAFSSKPNLTKALALSASSFIDAIHHYNDSISLKEVQPTDWYNCSHFNSYFDARSSITTQRSFNALTIDAGVVTKTSDDDVKIQAEVHWFTNLPASLKRFTPQFIGNGRLQDDITTYYQLEFLPILPLNELYVHGRNPIWFWQQIFDLVKEFFAQATTSDKMQPLELTQIDDCLEDLYRKKTFGRLKTYQQSSQVDLHAPVDYEGVSIGSIFDIANDCIERALQLPSQPIIMHGDLCFSNMLFDVRGRRLKLIDPRGLDCHNNFSIFGDLSYDLAKLAHSVVGMYDFIIAGRFEIVTHQHDRGQSQSICFDIDDRLAQIQDCFLQTKFHQQFEMKAIMPAVVLLFLSMLPLHADRPDRQKAMLLNAYRLYKTYVYQGQSPKTAAYHDQTYHDQTYNKDVLEG
ncbi:MULTISPECIES: hypothetical protein [Psychrobacter]|uniref:hypothetical protein n=1 Tax=Psychrobacter TaxID=497 RepID=UPI00146A7BE9|nr:MULTISPECIES: hypothetical protein [Psychrobacter]